MIKSRGETMDIHHVSKSETILFADSSLSNKGIFADLLEIQILSSFGCFSTLKYSLCFVCSLSNHS